MIQYQFLQTNIIRIVWDSKENYKWYMKVKQLRYTYYVSAPSEPK